MAPELVLDAFLKDICLIDAYSIGVTAFHMCAHLLSVCLDKADTLAIRLIGQQSERGTACPFDIEDDYYGDTEERTWFQDRCLAWDKLPSDVPDAGSCLSLIIADAPLTTYTCRS